MIVVKVNGSVIEVRFGDLLPADATRQEVDKVKNHYRQNCHRDWDNIAELRRALARVLDMIRS